MAERLFRKLWQVLNTDMELSETLTGGVEAGRSVLQLADALQKNYNISDIKQIVEKIDSVLDVLNLPLGEIASRSLSFIPIINSLFKYIEETCTEATLTDSTVLLSQVAYLESLSKFLRDYPEIELQEVPASTTVALQMKQLSDRELEFGDRHARDALICFHDSPLAKKFNKILEGRLIESGLTVDAAATVTQRVSRSTHRYMKEAVAEVKDAAKRLAGIYGDRLNRDLETYSNIDKYLQDVIATQPEVKVFNQGFTLGQIYVPLPVQPLNSDGTVDRSAPPENIEMWATREKSDRVLFVEGGPERGKSAFCQMFADLLRRKLHPIYTPILIRLQDVTAFERNIDDTLSAAVGWDFAKGDWLDDRNTRFLFLLDGFEELLLGLGVGYPKFLQQLLQFQKQAAASREREHRVLIAGRFLATFGIEESMLQKLERGAIEPMTEELQQQWLEKWQAVVDADPTVAAAKTEKIKEFLTHESCPQRVKELAREPLWLYLLAAMHGDGKLELELLADMEAQKATELVYELGLEWLSEKEGLETGALVKALGRLLGGANLRDANLSHADLRSADLSNAQPWFVNLNRANLRDADLRDADLRSANLSSANLSSANLSNANLYSANLNGANLSGAMLRYARLSGVELRGANLSGANLYSAHFSGADLSNLDLSNADLSRRSLNKSFYSGIIDWLRWVHCLSGTFNYPNFSGANLSGANLSGNDFSRGNFSGANFTGADFGRTAAAEGLTRKMTDFSADFRMANLSGANFTGANFSFVNLRDVNLKGANLREIQWNNDTSWSHAIGLHEATEVPETLKQDPEFAAAVVLSRGHALAKEGKIDEAIAAYREAQTINPQLEISSWFWTRLCWYGCFNDRAADVLFAGEKAVEFDKPERKNFFKGFEDCELPEEMKAHLMKQQSYNGYYRDTRGLARALTGDIAGAIADFQAALDTGLFKNREKELRQLFLKGLRAGENPFTPKALAALREFYSIED